MSPDFDALPGLIAVVDAKLATLPRIGAGTGPELSRALDAYRLAVARLEGDLSGEGARISHRSNGETHVTLGGVAAVSTAGLTSALHNWRTSAVRRLRDRVVRTGACSDSTLIACLAGASPAEREEIVAELAERATTVAAPSALVAGGQRK